MINIFFVPGMFGSTVEFCLRNFTNEYTGTGGDLIAAIKPDGSMHTFNKELHLVAHNEFDILAVADPASTAITTPIYPTTNKKLTDLLEIANKNQTLYKNKNILIYAKDFYSAELNLLFQYEKIHIGLNVDIFTLPDSSVKHWNSDYNTYHDMNTWEQREWISLYYQDWITEWTESVTQVDSSFMTISNTELLDDLYNAIVKIVNFCNLTLNHQNLYNFSIQWKHKQNYIVEQLNTCNLIVYNIINQIDYSWDRLNFLQESIIQKKLRDFGYEIQCWNLNEFPTNTTDIYNILEKV